MPEPNAWAVSQGKEIEDGESAGSAPETAGTPSDKELQPSTTQSQQPTAPKEAMAYSGGHRDDMQSSLQPSRFAVSPSVVVWSVYLVVAAVLFLRLVLGLAAALRLWLTATP